jgi:hypothetical protein
MKLALGVLSDVVKIECFAYLEWRHSAQALGAAEIRKLQSPGLFPDNLAAPKTEPCK